MVHVARRSRSTYLSQPTTWFELALPRRPPARSACAVALIDRLRHHAEILSIEGKSYTGEGTFATQQDTLNRLLKPFKLRLSLAPLPGKTRPNAA